MIIGNGLLANAFASYRHDEGVCIFASGVSNSQNEDNNLFLREENLLLETIKNNENKIFVYFSTCSIYDSTLLNSKYVQHKIKMENFIKHSSKKYIIFRISNPIWYTKNPNTIFNFLTYNINQGKIFTLWNRAMRNLIDIEDLYKIISYILDNRVYENTIINIANTQSFYMIDIVSLLEECLWKKALYSIEEKWWSPLIDLTQMNKILQKAKIQFDNDYLRRLVFKYCWK